MDNGDLQLALIQKLLEAPGNLEGWKVFLSSLCRALDGTCAELISHEAPREGAASSVAVSAFLDATARQAYQEYWWREDPWAAAARVVGVSSGDVASGDALIARASMRRTPFFNDFGMKWEITQTLCGLVEVSAGRMSAVSINRSERHPRFGRAEGDLLTSLVPHIQRALTLHRRLEGAETMVADLAAAADELTHGVLLLDGEGRVEFANRVAAAILRRRDGLLADAGEVIATEPRVTDELRAAVKAARDVALGVKVEGPPSAVRVPRTPGKRPYFVLAAALPRKRAMFESRPLRVVVFVTDPERRPTVSTSQIRSLFRLTNAEANLVVQLCDGMPLEQAAAALRISVLTARTRLKVVFQKTGTHRQADLVRTVLLSVASLTS